MPSMTLKSAPTEKPSSFLSKAWQYLQPKNSKADSVEAEVYRKPNDLLFPNEMYPELSKPCRGPDATESAAQRSLSKSFNRNKTTAINNSFTTPRLSIKRYRYPWAKQLNTENSPKLVDKPEAGQSREGEEEGIRREAGVFTVELIKHPNGYLGIVLVGGIDTPLQNHYVNSILPSSSASKSGCVKVGDQILEVNDHNLREATHAEALRIFRCLPSVVKLVIARSEDANRTVLQLLVNESAPAKKNNNLSPQEGDSGKPKSAFQAAADTSVVPKSVSSVLDVTRRAGSRLSDVQRVSRCSSFIGSSEDVRGAQAKQSGESNLVAAKSADPAAARGTEGEEEAATSDSRSASPVQYDDVEIMTLLTRRNTMCGFRSYLQTLDEENASLHSAPFLRDAPERHSMISSSSSTWSSPALKQRMLFPWEHTKHVTMKRSSSPRLRSSAAVTSSNSNLHQNAAAKIFGTPSGKNCQIEKETLTVQICKGDAGTDWGFTVGGGVLSPYGDLPIYIVHVSDNGPVHGILKSGDEIVEFSGDSFGSMTLLEAERHLGRSKMDVTVTIKRKFLQRTGSMREQSNPYADTWTK